MIQFDFENIITASNREPYNNVAAHEELKSMMSRFDRLNIFFDIDEDGGKSSVSCPLKPSDSAPLC